MATLVMKFGGSLTSDTKRLSRVAQVIMAESLAWQRMVVVVAAMSAVTDSFAQAIELAAGHNAAGYRRVVAEIRDRHLDLLRPLIKKTELRESVITQLDRVLRNVLAACDRAFTQREATPRDRDLAMAAGEQMMVAIVTALVRQEGLRAATVEAESLIVTDDSHHSAHPINDLIDERADRLLRPMLDAGIVPIIAGFIGATKTGVITTLGRGGSDYTATLLAASLRADEVWIWTMVDGIMSADPQLIPGAQVIPTLSYEEVSELSYFGARILHPRTVEPLQSLGIPLRVRNPFNLDHAGTLIQAQSDAAAKITTVKAVTAVDGLCLYTNDKPIDLGEFLGRVHRLVGKTVTGPVIAVQSHFKSTLVFVVPTSEGPNAVANAAQRLSASLSGWEVIPAKVIAMMGTGQVTETALLSYMRPLASAVGPGDRQILCVSPADAQLAVRQLHKLTEQSETQVWPPVSR